MLDVGLDAVLEILVPLLVVGTLVAWFEVRLYRWDPALFRNGLRILHRRCPIAQLVRELPVPSTRGRIFGWRAQACRLGRREVAVVVPVWIGFLHVCTLRIEAASNSLELVGHLHGVRWLVPLTLAITLQERALIVGVLVAAATVWLEERRRIIATFDKVSEQLRAGAQQADAADEAHESWKAS